MIAAFEFGELQSHVIIYANDANYAVIGLIIP